MIKVQTQPVAVCVETAVAAAYALASAVSAVNSAFDCNGASLIRGAQWGLGYVLLGIMSERRYCSSLTHPFWDQALPEMSSGHLGRQFRNDESVFEYIRLVEVHVPFHFRLVG
jgi:hypothetical protein